MQQCCTAASATEGVGTSIGRKNPLSDEDSGFLDHRGLEKKKATSRWLFS
jgi:hypothetical protein